MCVVGNNRTAGKMDAACIFVANITTDGANATDALMAKRRTNRRRNTHYG